MFNRLGKFCLLTLERHDDAFAVVDRDADFEVTEVQAVAVEQASRIAIADWFFFIVNENAIATKICEVVHATSVVDCRVSARDVFVRVGQNPVVLQRAPDCAAVLGEFAHSVVADDVAVFADYFEMKRHRAAQGQY